MLDIPPPTVGMARAATHYVLDDFASLLDGKLSVSQDCPRAGTRSRVCAADVTPSERFRVIVTMMPHHKYLIRARPA